MNEMSSFWSGWITVIVLINIFGCLWIIWWTRRTDENDVPQGESMGHSFDGIEELNNPMPSWWLNMFYATIIFTGFYLFLYPGLGSYKGVLGWTSTNQWEQEVEKADNRYDRIFTDYAKISIEDLANDPEAIKVGQRLFGNNCAVCHGSDARGSAGFPNLTDTDWLYGGDPKTIKQTLTMGRNGNMPNMSGTGLVTKEDVTNVASHVLRLSGRQGTGDADKGKDKFAICTGCHSPDGTGNKMLGAPNLTDNIWLYGGSEETITETLTQGRKGAMPAFKEKLGDDKIHILTAYIYSLSL